MFKLRFFDLVFLAVFLLWLQGCSRYTRCTDCNTKTSDQSIKDVNVIDSKIDSSIDVENDQSIDLCIGVVCDSPPATACQGNTLRAYDSIGTCDSQDGTCSYTYTDELCVNGCVVDTCNINIDPITYLKASNAEAGDQFGFNLAIDNDTIVVGAEYEDSCATGINNGANTNACGDSGAVYIYVVDQS